MTRFLRDGKKERSEMGGIPTINNEGEGDEGQPGEDGARGGVRDEIHRPDIPLKNINLEAAGKANKNRHKCLIGEEKVARALYEKSEAMSSDPAKDPDRSQNSKKYKQNSSFTLSFLNDLMSFSL